MMDRILAERANPATHKAAQRRCTHSRHVCLQHWKETLARHREDSEVNRVRPLPNRLLSIRRRHDEHT